MDSYVIRFLRSSLVWLGVGAALGLWMVFDAGAIIYRPAHLHANLLGFVSMMIFGVGYHVLPRFGSTKLVSRRSAMLHVWLANGGLALMVAGFITRVHAAVPGALLL